MEEDVKNRILLICIVLNLAGLGVLKADVNQFLEYDTNIFSFFHNEMTAYRLYNNADSAGKNFSFSHYITFIFQVQGLWSETYADKDNNFVAGDLSYASLFRINDRFTLPFYAAGVMLDSEKIIVHSSDFSGRPVTDEAVLNGKSGLLGTGLIVNTSFFTFDGKIGWFSTTYDSEDLPYNIDSETVLPPDMSGFFLSLGPDIDISRIPLIGSFFHSYEAMVGLNQSGSDGGWTRKLISTFNNTLGTRSFDFGFFSIESMHFYIKDEIYNAASRNRRYGGSIRIGSGSQAYTIDLGYREFYDTLYSAYPENYENTPYVSLIWHPVSIAGIRLYFDRQHLIPTIAIGITGIVPAEARVKGMEWIYNLFWEFKYTLKEFETAVGIRMGF
jgi:hypothetical protein